MNQHRCTAQRQPRAARPQSFGFDLRVADLMRDADMLPRVQIAAETLLRGWPQSVAPLIRRWVGLAEQYGRVG